MKRFLMLLGVAAVAAALYVAAASGGPRSSGPTKKEFASLKKEVAGLQKKVRQVTENENTVIDFLTTCYTSAGVVPVTQRGDPKGTWGYEYNSSAGGAMKPQTALDVEKTSPQDLLQAVNPSCLVNAIITVDSGHEAPPIGSGHPPLLAEHAPW